MRAKLQFETPAKGSAIPANSFPIALKEERRAARTVSTVRELKASVWGGKYSKRVSGQDASPRRNSENMLVPGSLSYFHLSYNNTKKGPN